MEPSEAAALPVGEAAPVPNSGPAGPAPAHRPGGPERKLRPLVIAALGVVYGDIGTSPLYAIRECFHGAHGIGMTRAHVLGVLSLIVWSLLIVISVKYLALMMRADNHGEGGILALMALVCPPEAQGERSRLTRWLLVIMGLFGAALLYGDGMITPAISVLSAVEGLEVATPLFQPYVLPLTIVILIGLFWFQHRGTAKVGAIFGPFTLLWFLVLAVLGIASIVKTPEVLAAANPLYAVAFFREGGWHAFFVMGSVFLVVTGGEALYADMGHFGAKPIRLAWFYFVLPALLLNYLGQGALLLRQPETVESPFYHLAPPWALYPLVVMATFATVIASQAVITGAFSLTAQAVQLGYLPRFEVHHTSEEEFGQIYIPRVNYALLVATIALVLGFGSSSNLAAAYGVAVTTTMVITTVLASLVMRRLWHWPLWAVIATTASLLVIDVTFFGASLTKVREGGWFPLLVGASVLTLMTTWRTGRRILRERLAEKSESFDSWVAQLRGAKPPRCPGMAVYLTSATEGVPPALLRIFRHLGTLHEQVVLVTVVSTQSPFVGETARYLLEELPLGFYRVTAYYGFMETPDIPKLLQRCAARGLRVELSAVTYVIGLETLLATERPGMAIWRERLFALMSRNAGRATAFFNIPPDQVLEIGAQIEL